jgi:large subunit ribosomal protein L21
MKYAIVEKGGKQYKAVEGSTIEVDLLPAEMDGKLVLDSVLLVVDGDQVWVGTPVVKGAKINTTIMGVEKGPKVLIFNYRAKKRERVKTGHRQQYTRLLVDSIVME